MGIVILKGSILSAFLQVTKRQGQPKARKGAEFMAELKAKIEEMKNDRS